jgi:hypothetical protein
MVSTQIPLTSGVIMAGKAKSVYLTVTPINQHNTVFKKVFFNAKEFNDYVKTDEFKALYPDTEYKVIKEIY